MSKPHFKIYMGPPEMLGYWNETKERAKQGTLGKEETDVWNRLVGARFNLTKNRSFFADSLGQKKDILSID